MQTVKFFAVVTLALGISTASHAQESDEAYWARWEMNYPSNDRSVLSRVRSDMLTAQRRQVKRPLDPKVHHAMRNCLKLFAGDANALDSIVSSEVRIKLRDDRVVWMPIQTQIREALEDEIRPGDPVLLFCLYLNWHNEQDELYNTFVISEFQQLEQAESDDSQ